MRGGARALNELLLHGNSLEEIFDREAVWKDHWLGWGGHLTNIINEITGADEAMVRQMQQAAGLKTSTLRETLTENRDWNLAKMRLLICDLAVRAYTLEQGRNPAKLADLVPEYLGEVPKDPFSGAELVYRLTSTGYLLYSVGTDRKDDGGKSCGRREEVGDILLDDPATPAIPPQPPGSSSPPVSGSSGRQPAAGKSYT